MTVQHTRNQSSEKRRSDRLMLTVPLRVHGRDPQGAEFIEDARTVTLNRHGACIQIERPLMPGQTIHLTNLVSRRGAPFRVVGPVSPRTDKGGEWGVECQDQTHDIWGIQFPPSRAGEDDSTALLECRKCHSVAVVHLSLVEVDVLETSGLIAKNCKTCKRNSPWGYAEKQVAMGAPPGEADMVVQAGKDAAQGADQRKHRRVSLQLPVLVRDYYGGVEITKSENVSKGGFCFISEKDHLIGEGVLAACPYSASEHSIEVRAKIVRRQEVRGTEKKVYGVRYEQQAG
jgi:PilZ domain